MSAGRQPEIRLAHALSALTAGSVLATVVSVLAYVGPIPFSEACASLWEDMSERTLTIHA